MASDLLVRARDAYARKAWAEARTAYEEAARESALDLDCLEQYAVASHLLGDNDQSRDILAQGYRDAVRDGERPRAARFAFWIGHSLFFEGRVSEAGGWWTRARQLLADLPECAEHGYLLVPTGVEQIFAGDPASGRITFAQALDIGRRYGDTNLVAIACHGLGRARIRVGMIAEGMNAR